MLTNNGNIALRTEAGEPQAFDVGDGALTVEPPDEGTTFENPPNGGVRAWLIVFSCAVIHALLSIMEILINVSITDTDMSSATGVDTETQAEISLQYIALTNLYAPLGAIVMIYLGYRATVCIGAGVVMVTVIILSHLKDDTEHAIKFFLYGPGAIGTSFIKLGVLIPVLEYFTTERMKALFLSRLGRYVGQIIFLIVLITGSPIVYWRKYLRGCTGLCIGIGLVGLTLHDLKLALIDGTGTFVEKTLGLGNKAIFRNILFWSTCVVYFFYQWGIETPQGQFIDPDMSQEIGADGNLTKALLFALGPTIGQLLGMFSAWIFKKIFYEEESRLYVTKFKAVDRLNMVFGILAITTFVMAIGCFIAQGADDFGYFFPFSILYGAFFAFCEGLRDDAVPNEFDRDNIRIAEGLILMSAGLGGVITNEIADGIDDGDSDDWKELFNYGGGMLLVSAIITSIVLLLKRNKMMQFKSPGKSAVVPV